MVTPKTLCDAESLWMVRPESVPQNIWQKRQQHYELEVLMVMEVIIYEYSRQAVQRSTRQVEMALVILRGAR
jgi:hypothetical protein